MSDKPIIVITMARSGSNLLQGYLGQLQGVVALQEIFRNVQAPDIRFLWERVDIPIHHLMKLSELQKTDRALFWKSLRRTLAARDLIPAAKIFYGHVPRDDRLWTAFGKARILHLVRENILAAIVSKKLASRAQQWKSKTYTSDYDGEPIVVSKRLCEATLAKLEENLRWAREKYRNAHYRELRYADIANIDTARDTLRRALGVEVDLQPQKMVQQRRKPLSEVVANYSRVSDFDRDFPLVRDP